MHEISALRQALLWPFLLAIYAILLFIIVLASSGVFVMFINAVVHEEKPKEGNPDDRSGADTIL